MHLRISLISVHRIDDLRNPCLFHIQVVWFPSVHIRHAVLLCIHVQLDIYSDHVHRN